MLLSLLHILEVKLLGYGRQGKGGVRMCQSQNILRFQSSQHLSYQSQVIVLKLLVGNGKKWMARLQKKVLYLHEGLGMIFNRLSHIVNRTSRKSSG